MFCKKSNNLLVLAAENYTRLGYQIGVSKEKVLIVDRFSRYFDPDSWDSISIMLDGLVCVDMDRFINIKDSYSDRFELPPTLKERSPRGLHYFYRLPAGRKGVSKIGWKTNVDILTKTKDRSRYNSENDFDGHVLCSPSKGYSRLSPNVIPPKSNLPLAPNWLLNALDIKI